MVFTYDIDINLVSTNSRVSGLAMDLDFPNPLCFPGKFWLPLLEQGIVIDYFEFGIANVSSEISGGPNPTVVPTGLTVASQMDINGRKFAKQYNLAYKER